MAAGESVKKEHQDKTKNKRKKKAKKRRNNCNSLTKQASDGGGEIVAIQQ